MKSIIRYYAIIAFSLLIGAAANVVAVPERQALASLNNLQWLTLDVNKINSINTNIFRDLSNLKELHLNAEALTTISKNFFVFNRIVEKKKTGKTTPKNFSVFNCIFSVFNRILYACDQ